MAEIQVADSGTGIGDNDPNRIFERLYRSGSAIAQQVPGAGLGLTIARAIVEAHGGTIEIVKSDASGTTFCLSIPVAEPVPLLTVQKSRSVGSSSPRRAL
jgi:protein-histidine pros-kinase